MTKINELETTDFNKFEKLKSSEFLLHLKMNLNHCYKDVKGLKDEIGLIKFHDEFQECPHCNGDMISYEINLLKQDEIWHVCSNCNYTYLEKQKDFFASLILHAIKETTQEQKNILK